MKKLFLSLFVGMLILSSCGNSAQMIDAVVVQQINVLEGKSHKYEVIFKTRSNDNASLLTNFRYQVDDTLFGNSEYFSGRSEQISVLVKKNDSLLKELNTTKYFLEIMKERFLNDSLKKKK